MDKIVMLDAKTLGSDSILRKIANYGELKLYDSTDPSSAVEHIGDAKIVITNKALVDKKAMQSCPELKLICVSATGMNNVDLEAAEELGIAVKNAAGYGSGSVAQHTFAMILQLIHQVDYYYCPPLNRP